MPTETVRADHFFIIKRHLKKMAEEVLKPFQGIPFEPSLYATTDAELSRFAEGLRAVAVTLWTDVQPVVVYDNPHGDSDGDCDCGGDE